MWTPMKKWYHCGRFVELVVGDDDIETPAVRLLAIVRDDESAERCLVLAAGDLNLNPIRWRDI